MKLDLSRKAAAFIVSIALSMVCMSAQAFLLEPKPMACMLFFRNTAVFTGKVLSTETVKDKEGGWSGWLYTIRVSKVYRGAVGMSVKVFTLNDSGRLNLDDGKEYLLFASPDEEGHLAIGWDGISGELADSKQAIADLEQITAKMGSNNGGEIFGRVVYYGKSGQDGLASMKVKISGGKAGYEAESDKTGWFQVHVPAGHYVATAADAHWAFKPYGLAWDRSDSFEVPNGGCAEIQLQADSK